MEKKDYIAEGFGSVTPFIIVDNANELLVFMREALGAKEVKTLYHQDGTLWHAQMQIGDSMIMVGDAMRKTALPGAIFLYVDDADAFYQRALKAGAQSLSEPADQFYGDRVAGVTDRFGNTWWFATHQQDIPAEELERRAQEFEVQASG